MGERIMLPAGTHLFKEVCVLAFFTVVASYSNLSTFFSGAKVVQINRMCNSLMFFCLKTERIVLQNHLAMIHVHRKREAQPQLYLLLNNKQFRREEQIHQT